VDSAKFKLSSFDFFFIDYSGLCYMGQKQALCQITIDHHSRATLVINLSVSAD
jgi:hypothetical protein